MRADQAPPIGVATSEAAEAEQVVVGDVPPAPRFPHGGLIRPSLAVVPQTGDASAFASTEPVLAPLRLRYPSGDGGRAAPVLVGSMRLREGRS